MANYITVIAATTYIEGNKFTHAAWDDLTDTAKGIAVSLATKAINSLAYKSTKTVDSQDNEFPRGTDTTVPEAITDACAELANALAEGEDAQEQFDGLNVIGRTFGSVSLTLKPKSTSTHIAAGIVSIVAWRLLIPYLRNMDQILVERV